MSEILWPGGGLFVFFISMDDMGFPVRASLASGSGFGCRHCEVLVQKLRLGNDALVSLQIVGNGILKFVEDHFSK